MSIKSLLAHGMNAKKEILKNEKIKTLIEFVKQDSSEAFIVGGWVRDLLLDVPSEDIDIVVHGDGVAFAKRFAEFIGMKRSQVVVFERFGTAKIMHKEWDLDFVGARKESYDPTSRNPSVEGGTIMDDLTRRDLTINAMSISLHPDNLGDIFDPFSGYVDLMSGMIRTPIEANETFIDDPLRMLRAIRFTARFDFKMDKATFNGIADNKERISIISHERICSELDKILKSDNPKEGLELLDKTGLMEVLLPEVSALKGRETKNNISHKDNFIHTLQVVQNTRDVSDDIDLLWVALLHDIGKAKAKKFSGINWTFHGHEAISAMLVNRISARLKWSTDRLERVKKIVRFHGIPKELTKSVTDSAIRRFFLQTEDILSDLLLFCTCDITTKYNDKRKAQVTAIHDLYDDINEVIERDSLRNWKNPVKGDWLIKAGMKPGRDMGFILDQVKEAILDGRCENETKSAQKYALTLVKIIDNNEQ